MTCIAVIGAWHNAHVTAACLANLDHNVILVNPDTKPWTQYPSLGLVEPGLEDLIVKVQSEKRLGFADLYPTDVQDPSARVVWLAADTPLREDDSPDVGDLYTALEAAKSRFPEAEYWIISSQVPVGFCQSVELRFGKRVAYVPENLQLGNALKGFMNPDRLVIGASTKDLQNSVVELLQKVPVKPLTCDLPTSEMIKHATNTFLATSISLANELASVGERFGADNQFVAKAMKMDSRIGSKAYVRPGLGFAGGTLPRDLRALQMASTDEELPLVEAVLKINDSVLERIAQTAVALLPPKPPTTRTLMIMGYTYKAETDTLRCSPVKALACRIGEIGRGMPLIPHDQPIVLGGWTSPGTEQDVLVIGYDPRFDNRRTEIDTQLSTYRQIGSQCIHHMPHWENHRRSRREFSGNGIDLFLVVTPLPEFKHLDWDGMAPAVVYDLCNGVDREAVLAAGLSYKAIWQPIEKPVSASVIPTTSLSAAT